MFLYGNCRLIATAQRVPSVVVVVIFVRSGNDRVALRWEDEQNLIENPRQMRLSCVVAFVVYKLGIVNSLVGLQTALQAGRCNTVSKRAATSTVSAQPSPARPLSSTREPASRELELQTHLSGWLDDA